VNKETRNGAENIMTKSNVPFRNRPDLSVFVEIDTGNQETRKISDLAASHAIIPPAKHANNTNVQETGGTPLFPDSREDCLSAHD